MILLIDNTKNLKDAFMTPKLLACLEKTGIKFMVASNRSLNLCLGDPVYIAPSQPGASAEAARAPPSAAM